MSACCVTRLLLGPAQSRPSCLARTHFCQQRSDSQRVLRPSVGVAFPHKEGIGFNIQVNALPTNGTLVALPPDDTADEAEEPAPPAPPQRDSKRRH
jgi:hypothetical protein